MAFGDSGRCSNFLFRHGTRPSDKVSMVTLWGRNRAWFHSVGSSFLDKVNFRNAHFKA